jgi:hypothetical protein
MTDIQKILADHRKWQDGENGGVRADLREADLRGADFDFSSGLPLWCGGAGFTCSVKFFYQVLAHLCTLKVDESEQAEFTEILEKIRPYALKSHRAGDLGLFGKETK